MMGVAAAVLGVYAFAREKFSPDFVVAGISPLRVLLGSTLLTGRRCAQRAVQQRA